MPKRAKVESLAGAPKAPRTDASEAARRPRGRPRLGKPVARHLPRDQEILHIAAEVFHRKGYEATKVEDVAREAGLVRGSIYNYFRTKEELYRKILQNVLATFDLEEEVSRDLSAVERLERVIRGRVFQAVHFPVESGLLVDQVTTLEGELGDWARENRDHNLAAMRQLISQGQKQGDLAPGDPEILTETVVGALRSINRWYLRMKRMDPQHVVDEVTDYLMRGLQA
jgi:TetR/AcrR family transcriptional regulator, cholesterol catabolism regulator